MRLLGRLEAPLRRLPSDVAGQAVVTYAVAVCLLAAALVLATSVWEQDAIPPGPPTAEEPR
jgi:hypothetical protein